MELMIESAQFVLLIPVQLVPIKVLHAMRLRIEYVQLVAVRLVRIKHPGLVPPLQTLAVPLVQNVKLVHNTLGLHAVLLLMLPA